MQESPPPPSDDDVRHEAELLGRRPRVLFINRCYWPDAEATGQLLTDLCETLADQFDISILCGQPNSNPSGIEFQQKGTERRRGVTIHRLEHTTWNKRRTLGRLTNLLSFTWAAHRWLNRAAKGPQESQYDVVICETDPFFLPIVTARYARKANCRFVAYLQDIYPDIAVQLGKIKEGFITRQIRKRLCSAYQASDQIVVLSSQMKKRLVDWGLPETRFCIIPNWADCKQIQPILTTDSKLRRTFLRDDRSLVLMHSGNMGMSQRLDRLVRFAADDDFPRDMSLVLVGGGAKKEQLQEQIGALACGDRVQMLPYQPREALSDSLGAADVQIVSVDPRIDGCLMPSKLYGILAAGRPVLVIDDPESDLSRLVRDEKIGWVADATEEDSAAEQLKRIAVSTEEERQAMGRRSRELCMKRFDRAVTTEQFATMLREVISVQTLNHGNSSHSDGSVE